ncbi:MAG: thioesterase family protein [Anaerolineae bacterium]|nr:thioesterase family protein [Anaerolineae bacterium]
MPLVHERPFRVRHYECDALGQVHHATRLRYMQEAAMDASAAAGYDLNWYEATGHQWLIRETRLHNFAPLRYGDTVIVRTWVADFRRVRSRRIYEMRHADGGALVARAQTDWVYMDVNTLRPMTVPQAMIGAFFPEGAPDGSMPREPFPDAAPPAEPFRTRRRVEWSDLDAAWHVNNTVYVAYIEDCTEQARAALGWPASRLAEADGRLFARRCWLEYKHPARQADEIEAATWITEVNGSALTHHYTITRPADDTLLVRARVVWDWIDPSTGQPLPLPAAYVTGLAPHSAG